MPRSRTAAVPSLREMVYSVRWLVGVGSGCWLGGSESFGWLASDEDMNSGLGVATVLVAAVELVLIVGGDGGGCRLLVRCLITQMLRMRESMRARSDASTHPGFFQVRVVSFRSVTCQDNRWVAR